MRFLRSSFLWTLGALILAPAGLAAELEPAMVPGFYGGFVTAKVGQQPGRKLSKEPEYKSKDVLYLNLELGSGDESVIVAALDESKGTGTGYDTVLLDANGNGDLTDDPKVGVRAPAAAGGVTQIMVPSIRMTVKYKDAEPRELSFQLIILRYKPNPEAAEFTWMARAMPQQCLQGKVDLGGRQVLLAILDGSQGKPANGCFNDFGADTLRLDADGDGKLNPAAESSPLGRTFACGGKLWDLSLDGAGRKLEVRESTLPAGTLSFSLGFAEGTTVTGGRLTVVGKGGSALVVDPCAKEPVRLPADAYRLVEGSLQLTAKDGTRWTCSVSGSRDFPVAADAKAEVRLGAPFKVEPAVGGAARPGAAVQVSHRLVGACGESYANALPAGGRTSPEPPRVAITDSAGGPVTDGKMEYG